MERIAPLSVSVIQTDLFWENKEANLAMLQKKIEGLPENAELVVLPEMFSTGFTMNPGELAETMDGITVRWMKEMAAARNIVLTGSIIIKEEEHYFNRLVWMLPSGQYGYYDKRHLFTFAGEHEHYSSGNKRLIGSLKGWKINLQICYDLRFPVWARQSAGGAEPEYDILINVANWPEKRSAAWNTLLRARAIENQAFVVGVNRIGTDGNGHVYGGDSQIINPLGEILWREYGKETVHTVIFGKDVLSSARNQFPFLADADPFMLTD